MHAPTEVSYKKAVALTPFRRAVFQTVARIPKGQVRTYGEVARQVDAPGAARAVGTALSQNCYQDVPCHRVVRSDGRVGGYSFGGSHAKARRLRHEGVEIIRGRVVFPH
ncbi:MAG: MGMT family protein [Candidatus Moraniibacteriota bacterium]|nr:MAG: MGMT family protein [Candidatus Moranbacteria bacterium]